MILSNTFAVSEAPQKTADPIDVEDLDAGMLCQVCRECLMPCRDGDEDVLAFMRAHGDHEVLLVVRDGDRFVSRGHVRREH